MSQDAREIRLAKIAALAEAGVNPYPERYERTHRLDEVARLAEGTKGVRGAGRVVGALRRMGKLTFAHLQDFHGGIQIALKQDLLGKDLYKLFGKTVDVGDFLGVRGEMFRTKTGELTVAVEEFVLLGKALRSLPDKWSGLTDTELCYRQRYLDLIMSAQTRARFALRTEFIRVVRRFLEDNGFVEVETPVLMSKPSGAAATPFATRHRSLGIDVYLRIAPETYLKRLIVAGYDRVFEFARCFRNEGMDPSHLQDFTMLEFYAAYWNYEDNMAFTERLIRHALQSLFGTLEIEIGGRKIDFSGEWPRRPLAGLIADACGIGVLAHDDAGGLRAEIRDRGIEVEKAETLGLGSLIDALYKKTVRPNLIEPTFVVNHPTALSPLARRNDADPAVTDRFQLLVNGWEIVNAYSELVDPVDQRRRFEEQQALHAAGDEEAMVMDEDYLLAMEQGMPPISGWGMGIDRVVTLLTGCANLRDCVLFPLMRDRADAEPGSGGGSGSEA